jgi:glycosyltransferase involved in cell wall biosynthesis
MSEIVLSVVIPCRDAEATLGEQLEAVAGQRWDRPWEVVLADNGSMDATLEIARRYEGRLPALRIVNAAGKPGAAHARNAGAAAARGSYLAFIDADDIVAPGWLAAVGAALDLHPFVACRYDSRTLNPGVHARTLLSPQDAGLMRYDYPDFLPHAGGGGLAVRREIHEAVGGFDETYPALEDTDYCWRVQLAGTPLVFAGEAVVRIRHKTKPLEIFRQGLAFGQYNVLIYRRYRDRGMPRLGIVPGLKRWAGFLLRTPGTLLAGDWPRWLWQFGWRLGRLRGSLRYGVSAF